MKLDLGCGNRKKTGCVGVDILPGSDRVVDLTKGWLPFGTSVIDEVYTSHFLEHLDIEQILVLLTEVHRVCKPDARVEIRVPHFSGFTNFYEFHRTSFRHNSFRELEGGPRGMFKRPLFEFLERRIIFVNRQNPNYGITKWFWWNYLAELIFNKMPLIYEMTGLRNIFPAWELCFIVRVIK